MLRAFLPFLYIIFTLSVIQTLKGYSFKHKAKNL
ncbi:hypothetical protein QE422_000287 [Chryseobacterium sp. SORGH_AS 447]|nr:hypothetical protein [Chryseobacterium sp. SORGH_AS_0447]